MRKPTALNSPASRVVIAQRTACPSKATTVELSSFNAPHAPRAML